MPIRLRIAFLYFAIVFVILGIVCSTIYYFSYHYRLDNIKARLATRSLNTARLLSRKETFNSSLVLQIDSLRTVLYKNNILEAYTTDFKKIYSFRDQSNEEIPVSREILREAMAKGRVYFTLPGKEALALNYQDERVHLIMVAAGNDVEGWANLRSLGRLLLIAFLIGNGLVLLSGYFFAYSLLQPIRNISRDVAEISAQNLARRIQAGHPRDEWSQLANTLNELLNRLQDSFEMQRRFISNASHELSTPLTSISSQLEVALQREREAGEYRQVMRSIYQDVQHMSKLTQTLLAFAKASGNPGGLDIQLIRVDEILLRLPAEIIKANSKYSMQLHFEDLPDEASQLLVYGNETLLFTAFKNITLNACKYSWNQQARVCLRTTDNRIEVEIADEGIGIRPEHVDQIFQPFYRVEENLQGGFGLGLSLASRIIGLHKGHINVDSVPGKGTTFSMTLPAAYT
jgi:two-component system sensor histidine kinase ArlS